VIRGVSSPLISRNRKVCPRASLDIIFIARTRNDPSSPEERRRVSRCFTKWHREEISGPSSAPPRVSNYENLSRGCCTWGSRLTCSRPIHFHFGTRVVTFVAFLQPLSTSIRRRRAEALGPRQRRKNKGSLSRLARYAKALPRRACTEKKWRYNDALRYALCIRTAAGGRMFAN